MITFLLNAAFQNQARGVHSAGFMAWNLTENKYMIVKKALTASQLVQTREFSDMVKFIKRGQRAIILGHTRQATTGSHTDRNAHPFLVQNIVGTHNGVLRNHDALSKEHGFKYEVDSEIIFNMINKFGPTDDTFKKVEGSMALAWVDFRDGHVLHITKDSAQPVSVAVQKDQLYYSSLKTHLDDSLKYSGMPIGDSIYLIGGDHLLVYADKEITKSATREVKIPSLNRGYSYNRNYNNSYNNGGYNSGGYKGGCTTGDGGAANNGPACGANNGGSGNAYGYSNICHLCKTSLVGKGLMMVGDKKYCIECGKIVNSNADLPNTYKRYPSVIDRCDECTKDLVGEKRKYIKTNKYCRHCYKRKTNVSLVAS